MSNQGYFLTIFGFLTLTALMVTILEYNHEAQGRAVGYSIDCSNGKCYTQTINSNGSQSLPSSIPSQSQNKIIGSRTVCINDGPCRTEPINSTTMQLGKLPLANLPFGLHP